jgi:hypothetical protein
VNLARIPGQVIIGHLSDLVDPRRLILAMAGLSAASVYAFWGRADGEPLLLVFSLLFGAFAGRQVAYTTYKCAHDPNVLIMGSAIAATPPCSLASSPLSRVRLLYAASRITTPLKTHGSPPRQRPESPTHPLRLVLFRSRPRQHRIGPAVHSVTSQSLQIRCNGWLRTSWLWRLDHLYRG